MPAFFRLVLDDSFLSPTGRAQGEDKLVTLAGFDDSFIAYGEEGRAKPRKEKPIGSRKSIKTK